ncbi:MAG: response regulator [Bacteroidota bacterium]|nr:response regulator [Bacteroidota bacterium]
MRDNKIVILLVEDNKDFARLVDLYLNKYENNKFKVIWKENGPSALEEAEKNKDIDIVLMDYFLPGMNGLEITKSLQEKRINLPIVFLTVNKDFELAIQVMKLRVEDYLVKEEITSPVLPKTILEVLEKHKLQSQLLNLEVKQKRIEAMQSIVSDVVKNISEPLLSVGKNIELLKELENLNETRSYLKIIKDNYARILLKFEKIRTLKQDKTITYIKGIKMIDLS